MPEYNPQLPQRKEGHFPNTGNAVVELHRLLAIFLASRHFAELCEGYPGEGFDPIHKIQEVEEVEEDEITRILLTLAVTARVVDDREGREGRVFELVGSNCGTLQKDLRNNETEVLEIREACSKLIHAKTVRFDVEELGVQRYLNPIIHLYGNLQGKNWRAQLDIIKFCKEYVSTVCHF